MVAFMNIKRGRSHKLLPENEGKMRESMDKNIAILFRSFIMNNIEKAG